MGMNQALLGEFDHEMASTRKALERVPDDKWDWKPHTKSGTMGWTAAHLANFPSWLAFTFGAPSLDINPGGKPIEQPKITNQKELLAVFDKGVADARAALSKASDQDLMAAFALLSNGQTIFNMPRIAVFRGMIMNHMIHHRGQLTVYFRLNDIPVPALYGPSADEQPMAAKAS
jgi:uncharacterized damage-inducible protein DinB